MQFILTTGWDDAVTALAERLVSELSVGRRVLWLTSGGSNVEASVRIMARVPDELSRNLSVMPVDERYGPPTHADSNWEQLMASGFQAKQAKLIPVLEAGLNFEQNTTHFNELVEQGFAQNEVVIAQLGIGVDGHIAGILPNSPACEEDTALVTGYESPPLKRMTLTFAGLKKLRAAYVLVFGADKHETLQLLKSESLPPRQQPAQILKSLTEVYIYNDQLVGDS